MASKLQNIKLIKTVYPGVFYLDGKSVGRGKPEKVYYIRYRKDGKAIKEKAGRQFQDAMTPARANLLRLERINGSQPTNREKRVQEEEARKAEYDKWTLQRLWDEYKRVNVENKSLSKDDNRFKVHLSDKFGDVAPSEFSPTDIDNFQLSLMKKKLSSGSIKNVLELLRRIINFGVKKHFYSPLGFVIEVPTPNNHKTEDLTPEELQRLLQSIEVDPNIQAANLMKLVLFTGMRRGELFSLQWKDIDFERGFIKLVDPKGGVDQKIPLNHSAQELLINHERPFPESPYVFPGRSGGKRVDIKVPINRIKDRAELPKDFRPLHGLRHVYASMLASSGKVDMYTLQKLLTHKSPLMTQRYAHLRDDALKAASNVAEDAVNQIINNMNKSDVEPI